MAAAVGAVLGAEVTPPPLPDEVRDQFDALLSEPLVPAAQAKRGHDAELLAALGIGR